MYDLSAAPVTSAPAVTNDSNSADEAKDLASTSQTLESRTIGHISPDSFPCPNEQVNVRSPVIFEEDSDIEKTREVKSNDRALHIYNSSLCSDPTGF